MVTRILFDPRRDLPNGTTQSNPVTIEATPTGIREDGQVVIYPTTISTPITTGVDIFQLPANTASNGWRLTVRDTITSAVKQQRVVRVPDQASIAYQSLPDIDPASFAVTPGTARQWDATFWALIQAGAGGGLTDSGIAALIGNPASAVAVSLATTYLPVRAVTGVATDGTQDISSALQALVTAAAAAGGGIVFIPAGTYRVTTPIVPGNKVTILGAGRDLTRLMIYGSDAGFKRLGTSTDPLTNAHFRDFTLDGANQTAPSGYSTTIKGFYIQFLTRCTITDVRIVNTAATGLGNDHHQDCSYTRVIVENCGRLNDGTQGGGAGIGIGTGGWLVPAEPLTLTDCTTRNNKRCGLFFETQTGQLVEGVRVVNHYSESNGEHGIADAGCYGMSVVGGTSRSNTKSGYACYGGTINPGKPGQQGIVSNLSLASNGEHGFHWDATVRESSNGRYMLRGCKIRDNQGNGVLIAAGATLDPQGIAIVDNEISASQKGGITVTSAGVAQITDLSIVGNRIWANGLNTGATERQGIRITANTVRLRVVANKAFDTQATKTQTYGFQIGGGTTHTDGAFEGNDLRNNLTGGANISGTVGATNNVGPSQGGWTAAAGSPEGVCIAPVGTMYRRTDGGAGTSLYVKESGTGATGWVAK